MRLFAKGAVALVVFAAITVSMFPPLELIDYLYWELSTNFNAAPEVFIMVSDVLLLIAGFSFAYSLRQLLSSAGSIFLKQLASRLRSLNWSLNRNGVPSLAIAALLIVYWHVPSVLDASVLQYGLHLMMHWSLLFAGFLVFVGGNCLSGTMRKLTAILAHMVMGIFGVYLLVTSGYRQFYSVYPLEQQVQLGLLMVVMMFIGEGLLVPYWLYQFFTKPVAALDSQQ